MQRARPTATTPIITLASLALAMMANASVVPPDPNCNLLGGQKLQSNETDRGVFFSVFSGTHEDNMHCELGDSGQTLVAARLHETEPFKCVKSPALSLFGKPIYYSLQMSEDGKSVKDLRINCEQEGDCGPCYYIWQDPPTDSCTHALTKGGDFSIRLSTFQSGCFGPQNVPSNGVTVFQYFSAAFESTSMGQDLAAVALSLQHKDLSQCRHGVLFGHPLFTYVASLNTTDLTYSLSFCNASYNCTPHIPEGACQPAFSKLPVGVCRPNQLSLLGPGHVQILNNRNIDLCQSAGPSPTVMVWILIGSMSGFILLVAAFLFSRKKNLRVKIRSRDFYEPLN